MEVKVIRSWKRRKTIGARLVNGQLELSAPAFLSRKQINQFAEKFKKRLKKKQKRKVSSDQGLLKRAQYLEKKYFSQGKNQFTISWSNRQTRIFGICNHKNKTIRLSFRLKPLPSWVLDYVIIHEMAHLLHPNHSKKFWQVVKQYPRAERAQGFLEAIDWQKQSATRKQ